MQYSTGQLIWLEELGDFSGKKVKSTRLCVVRRLYSDGTIDVRTLSTIYKDKDNNIPVKNLKEAEEVLSNLFETKIKENGQYVILEPNKDHTLNFSYTFGNMISRKINLQQIKNRPLLDSNKNPMYISTEKEVELSLKEAEAIAEDIVLYFSIHPKK